MPTIFQSLWMCLIRIADVYNHLMYKTTDPSLGPIIDVLFCHVGHSAHTSKGVVLRTWRWVAREGMDLKQKGKIEQNT
jgi:hypothetical protein